MNEITLSSLVKIGQDIIAFVYQSWITLIATFAILGFLGWYIMAYALNFDDRTHKLITIIYMVIFFFSILIMVDKGFIDFDITTLFS